MKAASVVSVETKPAGKEVGSKAPIVPRWQRILLFFPLAFLWWRLIDSLRVEWTVNPQYAYGWAVPFLAAYLLWHRIQNSRRTNSCAIKSAPDASRFNCPALYLLGAVLAFLYLPTRVVQEANPEWRLVSWALAFIVVGLTLLVLRFNDLTVQPFNASVSSLVTRHSSVLASSAFRTSNLAFPILFVLVAVPWPTLIEAPLIQFLARVNAAAVVEVLGWTGIPAMRHGNIIEIGSGAVGVDDACSGIRSFQATLMISLFLGEMYRLTVSRRVLLCFSGFALSFLFNLIRTGVLVTVAAKNGIPAISSWHDPAGVTILVGCFVGVWLVALALKKRNQDRNERSERSNGTATSTASRVAGTSDAAALPLHASRITFFSLSAALLFWLLLVEAAAEGWYRIHERNLPAPVTWRAKLPRENPTFRELPISNTTKQFLRYDEAINGAWNEPDSTRWQAIFLRWDAGRVAPHLAKNHTPDVCLAAAGREVLSVSGLQWISVHGLELPFRYYRVKDASGTLHVFYCLWEDRASERAFATMTLSYGNRLEPVLAGRRNSGQRSLEVVIGGITDEAEALPALRRQITKLVEVDSL